MASGNDRGVRLTATSLRDTAGIAAAIATRARVGDVILLQGEMGAGKTAFVQGFAAALGELLESGVLLVEWGEVASAEFPDHLEIELAPTPEDEDARRIVLRPAGGRWALRWSAVLDAVAPWREASC